MILINLYYPQGAKEVLVSDLSYRQSKIKLLPTPYPEIVQPGTSWSIDLFGPVQDLPVDSDRYMLLMVDSVSRYIVVFTCKSKSEEIIVPQLRRSVTVFFERQFGRRIREILTDQGSEFKNKTLRTFCEEEGIHLIHASTEDHAANGRAERNTGTIVADTHILLSQSQLGLKYWSLAAKSAAYTRNIIYNKNSGRSPLRILSADKVKILLRKNPTVWSRYYSLAT